MAESSFEDKLSHDFLSAMEFVEKSRDLSKSVRTELYGLQKQAMFGDLDSPPQQGLSKEELARHEAWSSRSGMSKRRCRELFVERVQELFPRFAAKTLVKKAEKSASKVLERLESSASMALPPKKMKRGSVATLNPFTDEEEGESTQSLRTRLRDFYAVHDRERLKRGLGDVLSWAEENGEEALNRMLKQKYGETLDDIEAEDALSQQRKPSRMLPEHSFETLQSRRNIFEGLNEQGDSSGEVKRAVVNDEMLDKARQEIADLMKEIAALGLNEKKKPEKNVTVSKEAERIMQTGKTLQHLARSGGLEKFEEILEKDAEEKDVEEIKEGIAEVINATELIEESELEKKSEEKKSEEKSSEEKKEEGQGESQELSGNVGRLGTLILRGGTLVLKTKKREKREIEAKEQGLEKEKEEEKEQEQAVQQEKEDEEQEDGGYESELSDTQYDVKQVEGVLHVTPAVERLLASDMTKDEFDAAKEELTAEEKNSIDVMYENITAIFNIEDQELFVRYAKTLNEDYLYSAFVNLYLSWLEDERFEAEFEDGDDEHEAELEVDEKEEKEQEGDDLTQAGPTANGSLAGVQSEGGATGYTQVRIRSKSSKCYQSFVSDCLLGPPELPPRPKVNDPFPDDGKRVRKLPPVPVEEVQSETYSRESLQLFKATAPRGHTHRDDEGDVYTQRAFLKQLTEFLQHFEPDRIDRCLYIMVKYKNNRGLDALNKKLLLKYGSSLKTFNQRRQSRRDEQTRLDKAKTRATAVMSRKFLPKFPRMSGRKSVRKSKSDPHEDEDFEKLVELYFYKYDPGLIQSGDVQRIVRWARKRGRAELNKKLKDKYNESLDEFAEAAAKLRDELIEYYKVVDRTRLVNGIDEGKVHYCHLFECFS